MQPSTPVVRRPPAVVVPNQGRRGVERSRARELRPGDPLVVGVPFKWAGVDYATGAPFPVETLRKDQLEMLFGQRHLRHAEDTPVSYEPPKPKQRSQPRKTAAKREE